MRKPSQEIIDSILKIFFSIGGKLTHEFISDGETLRIAEKPSGVNTFFTGKKIGGTLGSCNVKKITNIEVTERQIMFFAGNSNFMTVTRERCYGSILKKKLSNSHNRVDNQFYLLTNLSTCATLDKNF